MTTTTVRELARNTPGTRDRYADLLRVASLATVVCGHWLMAAVTADGRVGNLLASLPGLQVLTWVLQVMPVFFFVGGFAHALTFRSLRRRLPAGSVYAAFLHGRSRRLLVPTAVFVLVWTAAALAAALLGGDRGPVGAALRLVAQPLWFIGVYLAVVALTPPLLSSTSGPEPGCPSPSSRRWPPSTCCASPSACRTWGSSTSPSSGSPSTSSASCARTA
ncbi:acyltransferase [Schaalia naturae]|uniref:Acyltransferase n=1 Tax=Schaalia naturae TaxID=635203 RepID=A0ABW2SQB0_9ACTO